MLAFWNLPFHISRLIREATEAAPNAFTAGHSIVQLRDFCSPPSSGANVKFRAQLIFKSGTTRDFQVEAVSTTAFENMRKAFLSYLTTGAPKAGLYLDVPGTVVVDWRDVSAFHDWIEP